MTLRAGPAIVVAAYERDESLQRLLDSLSRADYEGDQRVPLIISIDHSDSEAVRTLAETFPWPHGEKEVVLHPNRLGLREHILRCGDLSARFGAVIVLEDDILVAPNFYGYARRALEAYADDDRVGGVALYSYRINEFNNLPFLPLTDGSDGYFLQVAASWGQAWTAAQWSGFRAWYAENAAQPISQSDGLPLQLEAWSDRSWKKYAIKYLVTTGRFFAYPHFALSTNTAKPGSHTRREVNIYQVPLDMGPRVWRFARFDESLAIYDVFYELAPVAMKRLRPEFANIDFDVDLAGQKPSAALTRPYLISARPCLNPQQCFGLEMQPLEANVAYAVPGAMFSLAPRASFGAMSESRKLAILRHLNRFSYWNKYLFQLLKPLQTRLLILRSGWTSAKGARA